MVDYEVQSILNLLENDVDCTDFILDIEKLQYQGFDPKMLMAHMWALAKKAGLSQADHVKHLRTMAATGMMRGSNIANIEKKSTPELANLLANWRKVYGLTGGKPTGPKSVTLVRVTACLAKSMSSALNSQIIRIAGAIPADSVTQGFPPGMALAAFGSLLPATGASLHSDIVSTLTKAFLYHQLKFDQVINSNKKNRTPSLASIQQFANIQFQSMLYSQEVRLQHAVEIGVLQQSGGNYVLTNKYASALQQAANLWDQQIS